MFLLSVCRARSSTGVSTRDAARRLVESQNSWMERINPMGWDHIVFLARDETLLAGVSLKLDVPGADASPMYQKKLDKAELAENILSA